MKQAIIQFVKFGMVGGLNTVLSYLIYIGLIALGVHYLVADIIAFIVTVFFSYLLNGRFVFKGEGSTKFSWQELFKVYASYSCSSLFLSLVLLWIEVDLLHIPAQIGPIINIFITIPLNFVLNKFWAFRKKEDKNAIKN